MLKNNQIKILKKTLNLDEMKNDIRKQMNITKSQRCCNVMKKHTTKLRVEMNDKKASL